MQIYINDLPALEIWSLKCTWYSSQWGINLFAKIIYSQVLTKEWETGCMVKQPNYLKKWWDSLQAWWRHGDLVALQDIHCLVVHAWFSSGNISLPSIPLDQTSWTWESPIPLLALEAVQSGSLLYLDTFLFLHEKNTGLEIKTLGFQSQGCHLLVLFVLLSSLIFKVRVGYGCSKNGIILDDLFLICFFLLTCLSNICLYYCDRKCALTKLDASVHLFPFFRKWFPFFCSHLVSRDRCSLQHQCTCRETLERNLIVSMYWWINWLMILTF